MSYANNADKKPMQVHDGAGNSCTDSITHFCKGSLTNVNPQGSGSAEPREQEHENACLQTFSRIFSHLLGIHLISLVQEVDSFALSVGVDR